MSRKGENIYKRKDGRWEGRYIKARMATGRAKYGYVYAKTYAEVKQKLYSECKLYTQADLGIQTADSTLFQNIAQEWMQFIQPQIKESTNVKYHNLLKNYILPSFGNKQLSGLTHDFLKEYCTRQLLYGGVKGTGLSPKTVSDTLSLIRNILRFAENTGRTPACDGKYILIRQTAKEMRVLSRSEQDKLCQYLYSDLNVRNAGILICLFTGLRVGEICALRWEDISLSEKLIYIHRTVQRIQISGNSDKKTRIVVSKPKSSSSIRKIPLPDDLVGMILKLQSEKKGYFLTGSRQPLEPRTMQNHFKRVLERGGVPPANFHSRRHTFATRCFDLVFDVKSLSEILGHANVNITLNRYVHPSMELKRENMQRISSLIAVR